MDNDDYDDYEQDKTDNYLSKPVTLSDVKKGDHICIDGRPTKIF